MALSILISFSSNSFLLFSPAYVLLLIGILSNILLTSFFVYCRSANVCNLSSSPMSLVPGGTLASSSCLRSRSTLSSASLLYLLMLYFRFIIQNLFLLGRDFAKIFVLFEVWGVMGFSLRRMHFKNYFVSIFSYVVFGLRLLLGLFIANKILNSWDWVFGFRFLSL